MKRRFSKLAVAAILCTAFLFVYSVGALAAAALQPAGESTVPTVTLTATSSGAAFGFNRESGNLFDSFNGVMPGDELTQTVRVQAASGNPNKYRIYLYAAENAEDETIQGFLNAMNLTVTDAGGNVLKVLDAGQGTEGVLLGTFAAGQTTDLTVTLTVPITMDNTFQGAESPVNWMFYAEQVTSGGGGGSPSGGGSNGGGGNSSGGGSADSEITVPDTDIPQGDLNLPDAPEESEVTVPDTEVPLGLPEIDVEQEAVPLASVPKTGDNSHLMLFIVLMVASGTGLTALLLTGKRADEKKK